MKMRMLIAKYLEAKAAEEAAKQVQNDLKGIIFRGFQDKGVKSHRFEIDGQSVNATVYQSEQAEYDIAVLERLINKEVLDEIVDVHIDCSFDVKSFRRLMKILCPTPTERKLLMSMLSPVKKVNKRKLQEKFDVGEIEIADIGKARIVGRSSPVVKITPLKDE